MIKIDGKWLAKKLNQLCEELECTEVEVNNRCPFGCPINQMIIEAETMGEVTVKGE